MSQETDRLHFIHMSCGQEQAQRFAEQTLSIYRRSLLNPNHHASRPTYRRRFIESYLDLKRYVLQFRDPKTPQAHDQPH